MIKKWMQRLKQKVNFATKYGKKTATETVVNRFQDYRAITNVIIFLSVPGFLLWGKYFAALIAALAWHQHVMMNQLWWRITNIEHYYIRKEEKTDDDNAQGSDLH